MENRTNILILGAGPAGLGAAFAAKKNGIKSIILEKDETYGGLCGNFEIDGFRFDRFVHFSHTQNEYIKECFNESTQGKIIAHIPNPYNIYKGTWIKHPAQNNLFPLEEDEKKKIVDDFLNRPSGENFEPKNYEEWLRIQYGNYFAENFPMVYTKKYWMCEAKDLETKWVGQRLYQPSVEEVIEGCKTAETPLTYYAKEMRYPEKGGYKSFLNKFAEDQDIRYNQKVVNIDTDGKQVMTSNGDIYKYDHLVSSIPLPLLVKMISNVPQRVLSAAKQLKVTSGYQISIGLKSKNIPPYIWFYIYDEDILPARVYSPSLKSPDNAPEGCASLQLEVYCEENQYSEQELYARSVQKLIDLNIINKEDILFVDIRFEKFANVSFTQEIYQARDIVRTYLSEIGIITIGRFGEWGYLWSDQSIMSGINAIEKINNYII